MGKAGLVRSAARAFLLVAVVAAAATFMRDSTRVGASHSQIILSLSSSPGGAHVGTVALAPGAASSVTLYVWAKDVTHDASGVAAFEAKVRYDSDIVTVPSIVASPTWLGTTGRSVVCTDPIIEPVDGDTTGLWFADVACRTNLPTPTGPLGSGLLASVTLQRTAQLGSIQLTNLSFLLNTTENATPIPVLARPTSIINAKCADFNGDGAVTGGDILGLVRRFGTRPGVGNWDPRFDLNADNVVSGSDIVIAVAEFGRSCTAA